MYKTPSSRKRKAKPQTKLNLIPILDSVFIFIFFLLMSTNFIHIFEIASDVPIISEQELPKTKKEPLALIIEIEREAINVFTGTSKKLQRKIANKKGEYNLESLHNFLITLKKQNINEKQAILIPNVDLPYEIIVEIMDAVRLLRKSDEVLYQKDRDGTNVEVGELFNNIVFGNIR